MPAPKIPPHNKEAEQSVLGALLLNSDAVVDVAGFLKPEHFYEPAHVFIYQAILSLYEDRQPIDLVTLGERLKKKRAFKSVGGPSYLTDLVNLVPTAAHAEYYGQIVKDHWTRRQLIKISADFAEKAFETELDTASLLDGTEQEIFSLSQQHISRGFIQLKDALAESFDRLDEIQKKPHGLRGLPTGYPDLDNVLAGMQDSNLLILASRPGIGKTSLALNIAQHVAVNEGTPVGFFSLEMSKEELIDRLLVSQASIDSWKLKTGKLTDDDFDRLQEAMGILADAPLYIDDVPGLPVMEMRTKARRLQAEQGLKLLIVDYLQLAVPERRYDSRVTEVTMVSQALKNLARELKIPILALSQLSRAIEVRGTKVPQLADLRESGAIEQDADVVMFLYRTEEEENQNDEEMERGLKKFASEILTRLRIAKHRNGPLAEISLLFLAPQVRFVNLEKKRREG